MTTLLVFDMDDKEERHDYDEMYHAKAMASALFDIRNALRMAEKSDHSVDHLVDNIRELMADLPESIIG